MTRGPGRGGGGQDTPLLLLADCVRLGQSAAVPSAAAAAKPGDGGGSGGGVEEGGGRAGNSVATAGSGAGTAGCPAQEPILRPKGEALSPPPAPAESRLLPCPAAAEQDRPGAASSATGLGRSARAATECARENEATTTGAAVEEAASFAVGWSSAETLAWHVVKCKDVLDHFELAKTFAVSLFR